MARTDELITAWRDMGPVTWAESEHGFTMDDGKPITLEPWQRGVLDAWWENRDWVTELAISNVKKTGKTTLNAIITCWRWLSLPGEHFVAANRFDQAKGRQFAMVTRMVGRNNFLSQYVEVKQTELVFTPTASSLKALPMNARGIAGSNHWTASHTELWGAVHRDDVRAYEELTLPPGRRHGFLPLRVVDSYAGWTGESELWHGTVDRGLEGEELPGDWPLYRNGGLLLFHIEGLEAQERCFRGTAEDRNAYYVDQARSLRPNTNTRLHMNVRTAGEGSLATEEEWNALIDPGHAPLAPTKSVPLWVGMDGALAAKGDDFAIIAVYSDGPQVRVAWHKLWKGSDRRQLLKLGRTVLPWLRNQAKQYRIMSIGYDPYQLQRVAEELRGSGITMREVPQSLPELGPRGQAIADMVASRALILYDHPDIRVIHAGVNAREVTQGLHLKKSGRLKVDLMVALSFCAPDAWARPGEVDFFTWLAGEGYGPDADGDPAPTSATQQRQEEARQRLEKAQRRSEEVQQELRKRRKPIVTWDQGS